MSGVCVSKPYAPLYDPDNHRIIANTGRNSGKSFEVAFLAALWLSKYPEHDVMYCRANSNSIGDSIYNELCEKLDILGIPYVGTKSPYHIKTAYGNEVWFKGLDGDTNRTKGTKPPRPYSVVIIDECEEIRRELNLMNADSSFMRHVDETIEWKFIFCGNPAEVRGHWWNVWAANHRNAKGYANIECNWRMIAKKLSQATKDEIVLTYKTNPQLARFLYDGDISELAGGAYTTFKRDHHVITPDDIPRVFYGETIEALLIGGDGAIMNDTTALSPIAVMSSGRAIVLERFICDPHYIGHAMAPSQYADLVKIYMEWMERKYGFQYNNVPVYFLIDCAAADFVVQLRYTLSDYYDIRSFTDKNVLRNTATVNNVFARNAMYIVDYGGYYDWTRYDPSQPCPPMVYADTDMLVEQLESVVWKNNKLDPAIPNDVSDSLVYGTQWYANPENLDISLPERSAYYDRTE